MLRTFPVVAVVACVFASASARGQSKLFPPEDQRSGTSPATQPAAAPRPRPSPPAELPPQPQPVRPGVGDAGGPVDAANAAYEAALRDAKLAYFKALLDADVRLIQSLDEAKRAAAGGGDVAGERRADADARAAVDRLREHQTAVRTLLAPGGEAAIASARWGTGARWADVTDAVHDLTRTVTRARATPATLRADPAVGWRKVLQVVYFRDGERRTVVVPEDAEIEVPGLVPKLSDKLD